MSEDYYDVIIAGASIPGLCLVNYLAGKGLKILIVDLKSFKRIGEGSSSKIITDESVLFLKNSFNIRIPVRFIKRKVENTRIASVNGSSMNVSTKYYILDKKLFSAYLIGKIIDLDNVTLLERHVIQDFIEEDRVLKGINVQDVSRGVVKKLFGKILVDSSGSTAVLRRKINPNRFFINDLDDFDRSVVYEEVLETNAKVNQPVLFFDPSKLGAGYFWVIPEEGNNVCVGVGVSGKSTNIKPLFKEYKSKLLNDADSKLVSSNTGLIPMRRPLNSFVYRNLLLVGSSACQVNPLIVRDISYSVKGAYYASKAILKALKLNSFNTKTLWDYNTNYMRDVGGRSALLEGVRDFFVSLSTPTFEFIIENNIITPTLVENINDRLRKRDVVFNTAKLFLKPRLLGKFVKLANFSANMKDYYSNYPFYDDFAVWKKKLSRELESIRNSFLV